MHRKLKSPLTWFGILAFANRYKDIGMELARIQAAIYYLRGVRAVRTFFVYLFQMVVSVLFLVFGVILLEVALVLYLPMNLRVGAFTVLGILNFAASSICILYFFSGKRWLKQARRANSAVEKLCRGN